jgi:hypothetical protein
MPLGKHLDPRKAAHFVARPGSASDRIPALIWIGLAILALVSVRQGRFPTPQQAGTMLVGLLLVILAGSIAPRVVTWVLLALLVAAGLGAAPQLMAAAAAAQNRIAALSPSAGG